MSLRPLLRRFPRMGLGWPVGSGSTAPRRLSRRTEAAYLSRYPRGAWLAVGCLGACCVATAWQLRRTRGKREMHHLPQLKADGEEGDKKEVEEKRKISGRELRYKAFASFVYKGEPYMSARDFLDSLIRNEPRSEDKQVIDDRIVSRILKATPSRRKGSNHLLRDMWDESILSYGDYLFLLTALIKTNRQFEIAFRMYDTDGSDFIDETEFSSVEKSVTAQRDNAMIQQSKLTKSSLCVYLFGYKGNQNLYSKDFFKFIEDLQVEVRSMEFDKYSGGSPAMAEEDFARVLLRHTTWDLEPVFERLRARPPTKQLKGITFQQYSDFCALLNSLDDFSIAMTMYTIAGQPVSEEEFGRAAHICLDRPLDPTLVSTVFEIFDKDGDHKLSYREFLAVMKGWKLKGFKMKEKKQQGPWEHFKSCVKQEMRNK